MGGGCGLLSDGFTVCRGSKEDNMTTAQHRPGMYSIS